MTPSEKIAAKQIALQTAQQTNPKDVLKTAKDIYKWMIEADPTPPGNGNGQGNVSGK